MPKVHDRVLLALFILGIAVVFFGGFLNHAPNRLATGVATRCLKPRLWRPRRQ